VLALSLAAYLTLALAISNPLRSPLMAFFIVYVLWRLDLERQVIEMRAQAPVRLRNILQKA
jgi:hypothetical protein